MAANKSHPTTMLQPVDDQADAGEMRGGDRADRSRASSIELQGGRSIAVISDGPHEMIEIRASSGQLELRIAMTEAGPVLQLDGVRLSVTAADAIELQCKKFSVDAAESVELASRGTMEVSSEGEMTVRSTSDVRVRGSLIYLN